jgi:hypothetical protein
MAYLSSTSTSPNVPYLVTQSVASLRTWIYSSTHISSDIEAANFFTDGLELGFKIRDLVYHYPSTGSTNVVTAHSVITVGSTTTVAGQAA